MNNESEQNTNFGEEKHYTNYWYEQENWLDCNYSTPDNISEQQTYTPEAVIKHKIEQKSPQEVQEISEANLEQLYTQPDSTNGKRSRNRSRNNGNQNTNSSVNEESKSLCRKILRPHSTPATLIWLESNYELADSVCIPRSVLYMHYLDFCGQLFFQPVNAASFGKIIRQQFPMLTTRRLGTRGQSRYHYYGIAIKESSMYYQFNYSKKSVQLQSSETSSGKSYHSPKSFLTSQNNRSSLITNKPHHQHKASVCTRTLSDSPYKSHFSRLESQASMCSLNPYSEEQSQNSSHSAVKAANTSTTVSSSCPQSTLSISGHISTTLPVFPTTEELHLEPESSTGQLISTFLLMYRAHCQRVLDSIVRTNFDEVQTLLHHFWNQIPHHLLGILNNHQLLNAIAVCDIRLYSVIIRLTQTSVSQTTLSDCAYSQLEHFVNNFENAINSALYYSHKQLNSLRDVKCRIGQLFCTTMLELLTFSKSCPFRGDSTAWDGFRNIFPAYSSQLDSLEIAGRYELFLSKITPVSNICSSSSQVSQKQAVSFGVSIRQSICRHLIHFLQIASSFDSIWEWFDTILAILTQVNLALNPPQYSQQSSFDGQISQLSLEHHFLGLWTMIRTEMSNCRWSTTQRSHWSNSKHTEGDVFLIEAVLSALDAFALFKLSERFLERLSSDFLVSAQQANDQSPPVTQYNPIGSSIPDLREWVQQVRSLLQSDSSLLSLTSSASCQYPPGTSSPPSIATPVGNTYQSMEYSPSASLPSTTLSNSTLSQPVDSQTLPISTDRQLYPLYSHSGVNHHASHPSHQSQASYGNQFCGNSLHQDQTSLICFSMNFHANSIQVMTASQFGSISNNKSQTLQESSYQPPYHPYHHHNHQRHLHHSQNPIQNYYPSHYPSLQNSVHQNAYQPASPPETPTSGLYYQTL